MDPIGGAPKRVEGSGVGGSQDLAATWAETSTVSYNSTHAVTIDTVAVGNPGNAPDTRYHLTGFGSTPLAVRMRIFAGSRQKPIPHLPLST